MQITKLSDGSYQIITTKDLIAPDGTSYPQTYIEMTTLNYLNDQLEGFQNSVADTQRKIREIQSLESDPS